MTQLSGQTGDSLRCYNSKELKKIAEALVKGKQCSLELENAYEEIEILNNISTIQYKKISNLDTIISEKDNQIAVRDEQIVKDKAILKKEVIAHKKTKTKFAIITTILTVVSVYFIIH